MNNCWFVVALALMLPILNGCVTGGTEPPEGYYPDVKDPDPDVEGAGGSFCNPTGKSGEALAACYRQNEAQYRTFDDEAKQRQPWYHFTPDSWVDSQPVDAKFVLAVVDEEAAVKRLEGVAVAPLTVTEAANLTGKSVSYPGRQPFLLRGLYMYKETGRFTVFEKDGAVLVRHDAVGASAATEQRTGVVVFLGHKPKEVYVDCQAAQ